MAYTFRDRFLTPQVARAITSPSGILLAGAGTAAGILAGAALPVAVLAGAAAYAVRVALSIPKRPAGERVDPSRVAEPWRTFVRDAVDAQRRFQQVVGRARSGPVRDRLEAVGNRLAHGVEECWRIARQGDTLDEAIGALNDHAVHEDLQRVDHQLSQERNPSTRQALERTRAALISQLETSARLRQVAGDAVNRLRVLDAQLDEAVARAVEVSVSASDASELVGLTDSVDGVVRELEALRLGLEETSGATPGPGATAPGTA